MTVRRLTNQDRPALHALLREAPAQNLYLLGNLETLGFDHELCEFWGDLGARGQLRAVLNRYMTGWSCYGHADADWPTLARVMDDHPEVERLQDNPGGIPSLLPYLHVYRATQVHVEELMTLDAAGPLARLDLRTVQTGHPWTSDFGVWMRFQPKSMRADMSHAVDVYLRTHGPGNWAFDEQRLARR